MTRHIVYHSADLDGICSAAVALKFCRQNPAQAEVRLHPMDYGQEFPWEEIAPGDPVMMLDFSLPIANMYELLYRTMADGTSGDFLWYDHHKSAIEAVDNPDRRHLFTIPGVRDVKRAACEIAAQELLGYVPLAVTLLGRYDVWDHAYSPVVMPFQYGMRAWSLGPESEQWRTLLHETGAGGLADSMIQDRIHAGTDILDYVRQDRKRRVAEGAHLVELPDGMGRKYFALACNGERGSEVFRDAPKELLEKAEVLLTYAYSGKQQRWTFGLYHVGGRLEVDCAAIAQGYGGGGHKNAAGFQLPDLPEWLR